MKALFLTLGLSLCLLGSAQASGFVITPIGQDVPNAEKFDTRFLSLIARAQAEGKDLEAIRVVGLLKVSGDLDEAEAQELLGEAVNVYTAIPGGETSILTVEGSLQAMIDLAQLDEVLVLQASRVLRPQPAFSGHN